MSGLPLVSVVMATYNSSHLLRWAIESLRASHLQDWEAVIVGDHCTDDTGDLVASFADARLRFLNLDRNSGQQATPNNVGLRLARGAFVAFLNQDDLFLPHHLSVNLARMESSDAELICCPYARILPGQRERIGRREVAAELSGQAPDGRFDPRRFHVASSWFLRREVVDRVGPWRLERETWVTPSQDWLFRAWRQGVRIACPSEISLVTIFSGERKDSYRKRDASEQAFVFREMIASERLRPALADAIERSRAASKIDREHARAERRRRSGLRRLRAKLRRRLDRAVIGLGLHPNAPAMIWRHGPRRGGYVRSLKRRTG